MTSSTPIYRIPRTTGALKLDGKLDEEDWKRAPMTDTFVNTMTGSRGLPRATAKLLWDDQHLYLAVHVEDSLIVNAFEHHDDHLWQRDCVELFLDPDGDGLNYFELQVSPIGTVFDTRYDRRRRPGPYGHLDWQSLAKAGITVDGKANDDEPDRSYLVEVAIPFSALAAGSTPTPTPTAGTRWRANLYVMDWTGSGQQAVAWSPPMIGDFHVPARFGTLELQAPQPSEPIAP